MSAKAGAAAIRVMVSAPTALRRMALEAVVRNDDTAKLVGGMYGLEGLARHLRQLQPDVLLVDIERDDSRLFAAASGGEEDVPPIRTVVLIDSVDDGWIARALRAGVSAILGRDAAGEDILLAIQAASSGLILLEPDSLDAVRSAPRTGSASTSHLSEGLTAREIEILRFLAEGWANKAIAARLNISEHTVKFHISSLLAKMGATSRTEAVTQGIRMGLILI